MKLSRSTAIVAAIALACALALFTSEIWDNGEQLKVTPGDASEEAGLAAGIGGNGLGNREAVEQGDLSSDLAEEPRSDHPCVEGLRKTEDFKSFMNCLRGDPKVDLDALEAGFTFEWRRTGSDARAFEALFRQVRAEFYPDDSVELWSRLRLGLRMSDAMAHAMDRIWLYAAPTTYLEFDALHKRIELLAWDELSVPGEYEALMIGLGSASGAEHKAYSLAHVKDLLSSTLSPSEREARKTSVFTTFRLESDPVAATQFLADNLWGATRQDLRDVLFRVALEIESGDQTIETFDEPLRSLISQHPDSWAELKEVKSFGQRLSASDIEYLKDL